MSKSIFVSRVYEDKRWHDDLERWAKEGRLGFGVAVTGETSDVRQHGERAIKDHLRPYIRGSGVVLVLIGNDTHNHSWITYEIDVAHEMHKDLVLARIPGTTGAPPPNAGARPLVTWEPGALKKALGG